MIATLKLLKLGFLVWAVVELAEGHFGYVLALVVTFAIVVGGLWLAAWAGRRARSGSARGRGGERGQSGSHLITSRAHRGRRSGGRPRHTY